MRARWLTLAFQVLWPLATVADVRCVSEPRWGEDGHQSGILLVCNNPDPVAQTVELSISRLNLADNLPDRSMHVLRPGDRLALRYLAITTQPWNLAFSYRALFGAAREPVNVVAHHLPFLPGTSALVAQLFGGPLSSHNDAASRYAVDFGVPYGSVVTASRTGVVAMVKDGSTEGGREPTFQGKENLVIVYHVDDTWSVYGHLEAGSIPVKPGDAVAQGQVLGLTGKSGMLGGPHLHYALQMRTSEGLVSLPVRFETFAGTPIELRYARDVSAE